MASFEGWLRKLVWMWRDHPEEAKKLGRSCAVGAAVAVFLGACWRYSSALNAPAAGRRKARMVAMASSNASAFRVAVQRTWRFAELSGTLRPLSTSNTRVISQSGIPFFVSVLDPAVLHAKNNGGGGAGKAPSPLADALGIPLARARLQLLLEQRAARKAQTAAADAATANARAALASDEPPATEAGSEATVAAMAAATIPPGPARESGERRAIFWARIALAASPLLGIPRALGVAARALLPSWLTRSGRSIGGWGVDAFERLPADTFVCDVGPHAKHALVLNRFPVIPRHCVIVTRCFEPQEAPLTTDDLAALWSCVRRLRGFGFYNAGRDAGASQPRKHLQFVPFDALREVQPRLSAEFGLDLPIDAALRQALAQPSQGQGRGAAAAAATVPTAGQPFTLPALPFKHAICLLGGDVDACSDEAGARILKGFYHGLLEAVGATRLPASPSASPSSSAHAHAHGHAGHHHLDDGHRSPAPGHAGGLALPLPQHNLIVTPHWMLVVPRSQERWSPSVPVNSVAYTGLMLAKPDGVEAIAAAGPLAVLVACGLPLSA